MHIRHIAFWSKWESIGHLVGHWGDPGATAHLRHNCPLTTHLQKCQGLGPSRNWKSAMGNLSICGSTGLLTLSCCCSNRSHSYRYRAGPDPPPRKSSIGLADNQGWNANGCTQWLAMRCIFNPFPSIRHVGFQAGLVFGWIWLSLAWN